MTKKTRQDLIKEGKPFIKYVENGKKFTQVFISDRACEIRIRELLNKGCKVERVQ